MAKAADFGHGGFDKGRGLTRSSTEKVKWADERRAAKSIIEWDRGMFARERGYRVYLSRMEPPSCTPKNDMLVGWREDRSGGGGGGGGARSRTASREGKCNVRSRSHTLADAMESMGVEHVDWTWAAEGPTDRGPDVRPAATKDSGEKEKLDEGRTRPKN